MLTIIRLKWNPFYLRSLIYAIFLTIWRGYLTLLRFPKISKTTFSKWRFFVRDVKLERSTVVEVTQGNIVMFNSLIWELYPTSLKLLVFGESLYQLTYFLDDIISCKYIFLAMWIYLFFKRYCLESLGIDSSSKCHQHRMDKQPHDMMMTSGRWIILWPLFRSIDVVCFGPQPFRVFKWNVSKFISCLKKVLLPVISGY